MPVADSSVKLKITVQKEALKIETFSFSACSVSNTNTIFTAVIVRKKGKKKRR